MSSRIPTGTHPFQYKATYIAKFAITPHCKKPWASTILHSGISLHPPLFAYCLLQTLKLRSPQIFSCTSIPMHQPLGIFGSSPSFPLPFPLLPQWSMALSLFVSPQPVRPECAYFLTPLLDKYNITSSDYLSFTHGHETSRAYNQVISRHLEIIGYQSRNVSSCLKLPWDASGQ